MVSFGLRRDRMALSEEGIAASLRLGRGLANEGLAAPPLCDDRGRSRARLIEP